MTSLPAIDAPDGKPGVEPWVSVEEVAAYVGVKKLSIYRWIETRGLPARKVGRLWKLKLSHVDAWVQSSGVAAEESAAQSAPRSPPASGLRATDRQASRERKSILVIDAEGAVRDSVGDLLTNAGYRVLFAHDSAEAIEHLAAAPRPSLIVLDVEMPAIEGLQLRQRQMRDPELAAIPVVVVTAASSAKLEGISALLRKPLRLPLLAMTIESLIQGDGSEHRREESEGTLLIAKPNPFLDGAGREIDPNAANLPVVAAVDARGAAH